MGNRAPIKQLLLEGRSNARWTGIIPVIPMSQLHNLEPFDLSRLPLSEVLQMLFGRNWRVRAARAFRRSRRQIGRWCSGDTPLPIWAIRRIERLIMEGGSIERWRREKYQEIENEAQRRLALAQSALTACKLLRVRTERDRLTKAAPGPKRPAGAMPLSSARVPLPTAVDRS